MIVCIDSVGYALCMTMSANWQKTPSLWLSYVAWTLRNKTTMLMKTLRSGQPFLAPLSLKVSDDLGLSSVTSVEWG